MQGLPYSSAQFVTQMLVSDDVEMDRLVFVMFGGGEIDAGQAIARRQLAWLHVVALGFFLLAEFVQRGPVGLVLQRPRRCAADQGFPCRVEHAEPQALLEAGFDVAHFLQLGHHFRTAQLRVEASRIEFVADEVLGGKHAAA